MSPEQLSELLKRLLSNNNEERGEAEKVFTTLRKTEPDSLISGLLSILKSGAATDELLRQHAAVSIRFISNTGSKSELSGGAVSPGGERPLSPEAVKLLHTELIECLQAENSKTARLAVCDAIVSLAWREESIQTGWPELLPFVLNLVRTSWQPALQAAGLRLLSELVPKLSDQITADAKSLAEIIKQAATGPQPPALADTDVVIEALRLTAALVESCEKRVWRHTREALPAILRVVKQLCAEGKEDPYLELMKLFIDIAEIEPLYLKPFKVDFASLMLGIVGNNGLPDESRQMAMETLLVAVEKRPSMFSDMANFAAELIGCLMEMMLTIKDDPDWSTNAAKGPGGEGDDDAMEARNSDVGLAGLDRAVSAMGGENVLDIVFKNVAQFLHQPDWHYRVTGILAVSQVVEYLPDKGLDKHLEEIVSMFLSHMNDSNFNVRFASCQGIAQLALDHQPDFQRNYSNVTLPALLKAMSDPESENVRSHALSAYINFAEGTEKSDLLPFVDQFMAHFLKGLELTDPKQSHIQENSVTAIAVTAGVIEADFRVYVPTVFSFLKEFLNQQPFDKNRKLKGKSLECLSVIGCAIGQEAFKPIAPHAMTAVLTIAQTGSSAVAEGRSGSSGAVDPCQQHIHETLSRLCQTMKEDFVPYLPFILPYLLKVLNQKPQPLLGEEDDIEDFDDYTLQVLPGGQITGIRTSILDDMIEAAWTISTIVQTLGKSMGAETLTLIGDSFLPLLSIERLEEPVLETMADVLSAYRKSGAPVVKLQVWMEELIKKVLGEFNGDPIKKPSDIEESSKQASKLALCIRNAGPDLLSPEAIQELCQRMFKLVKASAERCEWLNAEDEDDEDGDDDESDTSSSSDNLNDELSSQELNFRSSLLEIVSSLMATQPDLFLEKTANLYVEFLNAHLQPYSPHEDLTLALYVADDILEHLKGAMLWPMFAEKLVSLISHEVAAVRQAAAYGINQAAKCPSFPAKLLQQATEKLCEVLHDTQSQKPDFKAATDNAIAAMGSILFRRQEIVARPQEILAFFIDKLPLTTDDVEARITHLEFLEFVVGKAGLVGAVLEQKLPKLISVCASIYRTEFSTTETDELIRKFLSSVGFEAISEIGKKFERKSQLALERIHRDVAATAVTTTS